MIFPTRVSEHLPVSALGLDNTALVHNIVTVIVAGGLIAYALKGRELRHSFDNILAGVAIGLIIPAGWYITGVVGFDDFEPMRLESYTFTGPDRRRLDVPYDLHRVDHQFRNRSSIRYDPGLFSLCHPDR